MAVAQIWWQARSGIDLLMSECIEAQAHVANTFKWLVHSMGSDSPPLRAIAVRFVATALRSVNVPNTNLPKTKSMSTRILLFSADILRRRLPGMEQTNNIPADATSFSCVRSAEIGYLHRVPRVRARCVHG